VLDRFAAFSTSYISNMLATFAVLALAKKTVELGG
jgi:hypothetical protein